MVMALGLGGPTAGMYHLTTHAFFKALLFLAAGSVIHGTHRQNIWELGGLWRSMRWTSLAFLVGGLALCGFPFLSGFFSKDEILVLAHEQNLWLYGLGTVTAGLTAFYIARAWFVAFTGKPSEHLHAHESPPVMLGPLAFLAGLSVVGGYLGIPVFLGEHEGRLHLDVALMSLAAVAAGLTMAWLCYVRRLISPTDVAQRCRRLYTVLANRYYVDHLYDWYVDAVQQRVIAGCCALVERFVIIGFAVNGTAWLTKTSGHLLRLCQTGLVQGYVLVFFAGVVVLLYLANRL